jgi:glycosyltransferase involved in cell wall biosynthesis
MKREADVSVLLATYNHASYLPRALDSFLAQSVRPREIIIVDDTSPDATPSILADYAQRESSIRVLRNDRNRGANQSFCRALANATGKYVYFAGADDFVRPGFIEKSMAMLERHPEAGLCCSYRSTVDGITGEISENPSHWCDEPRYFSPTEIERLVGREGVGHAAILRRQSVERVGGLLSDLEWYSDFFLTVVVALREGACHVPESLAVLTLMATTYSARAAGTEKQLRVFNALFDRLLSPEYADVAPGFRRSGVMRVLGPAQVRAAARRADLWTYEILGLINCFTVAHYEELLADSDPVVRRLAELFLGPFGRDLERHRQLMMGQVQQLTAAIGRMERSVFWRVRAALARCVRSLIRRRRTAPAA